MPLASSLLLGFALVASDGPLVLDVPADGTPPQRQHAPLFFAAPFEVERGRFRAGAWTSSDEILGEGTTRVIVVASWCPACKELLEAFAAQRPHSTVILLLQEEYELLVERAVRRGQLTREHARLALRAHQGDPLAEAAALERYPLPLYLLRSGSAIAQQVTHYPFMFLCARNRCTPERARR